MNLLITGVNACLDNVMGKILVTDPDHPKLALAVIGDFAFCAGEPDLELLRGKPDRWMIVVPQDEACIGRRCPFSAVNHQKAKAAAGSER